MRSKSDSARQRTPGLLAEGIGEEVSGRRILYFSTPLDLFDHPDYIKARKVVSARFPEGTWAVFEPARCPWNTAEWLRAWKRLRRQVDALVIWPRPDGSVGYGVYQEACDVQDSGKPVYVLRLSGRLHALGGFRIMPEPRSFSRYARVIFGKAIRASSLLEGGA